MAIQDNELYASTTRGPLPRIQPAQGPGSVVVRTFASGSATLPVGTPVYTVLASGHMAPIDPDEATNPEEKDPIGFVYGAPVVLSGSGEVLGVVMMRGSIHVDEINTSAMRTLLSGSEANLLACLRSPALHDRGLHIDGLTQIGKTS